MARRRIYLDNAATTWPKPEAVYAAVDRYQRTVGAAAGRGGYRSAEEVAQTIDRARHAVARLLGVSLDAYPVTFTYSGTDSLNLAIRGLLNPGDHVITTAADHNSVLRPLRWLESTASITLTVIPLLASGVVDLEALRAELQRPTRLVVVNHASNVTGVVQPVATVADLARHHGALTLVDAAQTLGHLPCRLDQTSIDLLAAPGHKGLLGPLGTGVLVARRPLIDQLQPLRMGGTGSSSELDQQPQRWPDRFEAGNANVPGLFGLAAGVDDILQRGVEEIHQRLTQLDQLLVERLRPIPGVSLFVGAPNHDRIAVVSLSIGGLTAAEAATALESIGGLQTRSGLHCAPHQHAALGTLEQGGLVRMSPGIFTTDEDIHVAAASVRDLAESARSTAR